MPAEYGNLNFAEAIALFKAKLSLPTETWDAIWKDAHDTGFVVAGAMTADLLTDLRAAVDKALTEGTTLAEFRKDFDQVIERTGWEYNGGRNWRTRLIYETNLRTAYAAGRYDQMQDPDVKRLRPYKIYKHGDSIVPRPEHLKWHNLVLPADDPFWQTHFAPNGWGCKCNVFTLSERDLAKMGRSGPDTAPKIETYEWTNPRTGETIDVPEGIDPGWDYAPGAKKWAPDMGRYPEPIRNDLEDYINGKTK
jgi:uncharacterized protein with gpF-like domain